ncbi:glycosyltransferase family 2 protein [Pseudovibrio exalbescens]|uniref:glycosyltransferase family 2 protein n=1 Tax=Pseudovibrio exalbescens TaxID=197461 RepID=UPI000C9BD92C|nr:glycosyltransferase [Pseudovibrio exalbescens]
MIGNSQKAKIGVLICTLNRPIMLRNCVTSLLSQKVPDDYVLEICIIENDSESNSLPIVEELRSISKVEIIYENEPTRGIPFARNKSLDIALERNHCLSIMVDDDEVVLEDFISYHIKTLETFNADISYGRIEQEYESPLPEWFPNGPATSPPAGTRLERASTGNVCFKRRVISPDKGNLRFNTVFCYGYEDLDFFTRAVQQGFSIVSAPDAVIVEKIPSSRTHPSRLLSVVQASATAHVQAGILNNGYLYAATKFLTKGLRRVITGATIAVALHPWRESQNSKMVNRYYKSRLRLSRGIGNIRGVFSLAHGYYNTIDGH